MSKANKRERQRQNRELAKIERDRLIKRDKRMRTVRGLLFVLVPIVILFVIFSLVRSDDKKSSSSTKQNGCTKVTSSTLPKKDTTQKAPAQTIDPAKTYSAKITTSCGVITVGLDAEDRADRDEQLRVARASPASTTGCRSTGWRRTS